MAVAGHEGLSGVFVLVQITSWCLVLLCGFGCIGLLVFVWILFCCVWATVFSVWLGIVAWRIWRWWICMQQQYVKVMVSLRIIRMHSNWRKNAPKVKDHQELWYCISRWVEYARTSWPWRTHIARFNDAVAASDEAFGLFLLKYYNNIKSFMKKPGKREPVKGQTKTKRKRIFPEEN